jgi:hypothetical protein
MVINLHLTSRNIDTQRLADEELRRYSGQVF